MARKDDEMAQSSDGPSSLTNDADRSRDAASPRHSLTPSPKTPPAPQLRPSTPLAADVAISSVTSTPSPSGSSTRTTYHRDDSRGDRESEDWQASNRRMVSAEEEDEPVAATPSTPPPPLPPPPLATDSSLPPDAGGTRLTSSPMVVQQGNPEELILSTRSLVRHRGASGDSHPDRQSPSPGSRVSNPVSPKALSSPRPCPSPASDDAPLDFSMKAKPVSDASSGGVTGGLESPSSESGSVAGGESPLDLSVPRRRKNLNEPPHRRKVSKLDNSPSALDKRRGSPWGYSAHSKTSYPGVSGVSDPAASSSSSSTTNAPETTWNGLKAGKGQLRASSSSNKPFPPGHHSVYATRSNHPGGGGAPKGNESSSLAQLAQSASTAGCSPSERGVQAPPSSSSSKPGRQNPWQTQWMSKSSEQSKAVFTCVFCQEPCVSLAEMTLHMKKSPHCGKAAGIQASIPPSCLGRSPLPAGVSSQPGASVAAAAAHSSASGSGTPGLSGTRASGSLSSKSQSSTSGVGASCSAAGSPSPSAGSVKESMPLPRKLVRGQDVWLGKGAEQTRQILKCMWCGQSFKTLADMTTHMRVTQHYTNIISQEQIISWRTPEDKAAAQSQVNAVLTCKVCDQAFGSLKELSYHMVKNSHYKEHILRSISEGGGRRRQTRERRKKSLPVRKLLELERMEMNKQGGTGSQNHADDAPGGSAPRSSHHHQHHHQGGGGVGSSAAALAGVKVEPAVDGKITCEECAEKVDAKDFVRHIKKCSGQRNHQAHHLLASTKVKTEPPDDLAAAAPTTISQLPPKASSPSSKLSSAKTKDGRCAVTSPGDDSKPEKGGAATDNSCDSAESTSVLNAIERLIEKSFERKGRRGAPSTGILQRLGIDEEVYPPWHPASSPGKMTPGSDGGRAQSASPSRLNCADLSDSVVSGGRSIYDDRRQQQPSQPHQSRQPGGGHHFGDAFNQPNLAGCGSETSRGSTPVSLTNASSPARSLTVSPHRTRSSLTGSTSGGSPPASPHSGPPLSPSPSLSSANQGPLSPPPQSGFGCRTKEEITSSPRLTPKATPSSAEASHQANDQETDIDDEEEVESRSRVASPGAAAAAAASPSPRVSRKEVTADPERPSRSSSASSLEGMSRGSPPASDSDASLRPASSAEEQPLELVKSMSGATKRKKSGRHHHHQHQHHHHHRQSYQSSGSGARKKKSSEAVGGGGSLSESVPATAAADQLGADHPLRELQKLLDKTDAHLSRPPPTAALQHHSSGGGGGGGVGPGSILAFSWACNDVSAGSDSLMKCAFCETHFISKGAYRHHLSKMHFVKEGGSSGGSAGHASSSGSTANASASAGNADREVGNGSTNQERSRNGTDSKEARVGSSSAHASSQPLPSSVNDETTHSKFLKYTELAKQLSSKYV